MDAATFSMTPWGKVGNVGMSACRQGSEISFAIGPGPASPVVKVGTKGLKSPGRVRDSG